jgi:hypothetical protein
MRTQKPTAFQYNVFSTGIHHILAAVLCLRTSVWVLAARVGALLLSNPLLFDLIQQHWSGGYYKPEKKTVLLFSTEKWRFLYRPVAKVQTEVLENLLTHISFLGDNMFFLWVWWYMFQEWIVLHIDTPVFSVPIFGCIQYLLLAVRFIVVFLWLPSMALYLGRESNGSFLKFCCSIYKCKEAWSAYF